MSKFTNLTATPVGLYSTTSEHMVAGAMGGSVVITPDPMSAQVIDIYVQSGNGRVDDFAAPANTALPAITGTAQVGQPLSSTNGTWTGSPAPTFTRQWRRGATNIASATAQNYTLVAADAGQVITVAVTATNEAGNASATSAGTAAVTMAPTNTAAPALTGAPQIGTAITASNGTWTGTPTPTYTRVWQRSANGTSGWAAIAGATAATYTPVEADLAYYLRCVVTGTNTAGNASANSNNAGPVVVQPV